MTEQTSASQFLFPSVFLGRGHNQIWIYRVLLMETRRCIRFRISLLVGISLLGFPRSCLLCYSLPSQVSSSPSSNSHGATVDVSSTLKKFLMESYNGRYDSLLDLDFDNFMSQEIPFGLCGVLPDDHNFELRLSLLQRNLIGEGSHRRVSTLIRYQIKQSKSVSELLSCSCQFIVIERLPSGVFADPFELQHLVQRGVFSDVTVFGDTNLELPSFLSNRSAVEIHLDVDPMILMKPIDINIELPLHARYQPLNESGYSSVKFGLPDMLVRCNTNEKVESRSCFFKLINDDANPKGADIVWTIPSGRKAHAGLVSTVTFIVALLSTVLIVLTSLSYSNNRQCKDLKKA
ncbi:hypothetical protein L6164_027410 [Bauhinia variegata]|uniref:Uncharacterized protein n=1 Tax=Bauhinia variegata TaxID=167791 RepID=A0ACB9LSU0_BAUVA|nr:hypothetical protein L6164_027410 [Bauhinia variegata]